MRSVPCNGLPSPNLDVRLLPDHPPGERSSPSLRKHGVHPTCGPKPPIVLLSQRHERRSSGSELHVACAPYPASHLHPPSKNYVDFTPIDDSAVHKIHRDLHTRNERTCLLRDHRSMGIETHINPGLRRGKVEWIMTERPKPPSAMNARPCQLLG